MAPDQEPREQQYRQWLRQVLHGAEHELHALPGDASFRRYIRVRTAEQHCILMDAPPEREDCRPFLRVSRKLAEAGLNVPQVLAEDAERGFVLLSDLGDSLYLDCLNEKTADRLYADALQAVHKMRRLTPTTFPHMTKPLLRKEMHLFTDWLLDRHCGLGDAESLRGRLEPVFALLVDNALQQPQAFVHRDYHSRNLMQTPGNNPGILDYQDAVRGPVTYDPVSLLKDCYVRWPRERVREWWDGFLDESPDADFLSARTMAPLVRPDGRAAACQGQRHFRAPAPARRQARIFARHPAHLVLHRGNG